MPPRCASWGSARATSSASTWAWCPSCPSRCWPAPGWARRTWWCSAGSRPRRWASGWSRPAPRCWSPRTRRGARATRSRSRRSPTRACKLAPTVEHMVVVRRTGGEVPGRSGRDHWWHDVVEGKPTDLEPEMVEAEHMLFALHTSGTTAKPKARGAHQRWLSDLRLHHAPLDLRRARRRGVLVCSRHRLGHRPQLHRVRATGERDDRRAVRGRSDVPAARSALGNRGALQGAPVLHRADPDPGVHQGRCRPARRARSVVAQAAGDGRRADQPGGLGVVPRARRRQPLSDRRYVVADRDGWHPDHSAAGRHHHQARVGHAAVSGDRGRHRRRQRQVGRAGPRRLSGDQTAVAGHVPHALQRR